MNHQVTLHSERIAGWTVVADVLRERYGADAKVKINALGVADSVGRRVLHSNDDAHISNSLLPRPSTERRYYPRSAPLDDSVVIDCTTIDSYLRATAIDCVDILKMDIQGGELMALRGAEGLLSRHAARIVSLEAYFVPHYANGPLLHDIWRHVADLGYTLFDLSAVRRADNGQARYSDVVFVNPEVRREVIDRHFDEP